MLITQTPLRVSFLGGGTDYPEFFKTESGAVLGTAIDKFLFFSITPFFSRLFDYSVRISYSRVERVSSVSEIEHGPFREILKWCGVEKDVEIDFTSELPSMSGLGSSSSFTTGLLNTIYSFQGKYVPPLEIAKQAIRIEREVLGESVGCQDQVFAAVGGFNLVEFFTEEDIVVHRVPLSRERIEDFQEHLLLFFTGITRRAENHSARQVKKIPQNKKNLLELRKLVDEGHSVLVNDGSLSAFGEILDRAWRIKRGLDTEVSNDTIDGIYAAGLEAGALGGKLLGAGGGGFVLFFVPPEKKEAVKQKLSDFIEIPFRINAPGTRVVHG